jgi:hypothetical protein
MSPHPLDQLVKGQTTQDNVEDHGFNGVLEAWIVGGSYKFPATVLDHQVQKLDGCPLVTIDETVISRHRFNKRCGLFPQMPVVSVVWPGKGGLDQRVVAYSIEPAKLKRAGMRT